METLRYKAVFFDIDGTLASFETRRLQPSAVEAVRALRRRGVKVAVATGRIACDLHILEGLPFDGYITVNGGSCLTADGEVVFEQGILAENLLAALDARRRSYFPLTFMTADGIFAGERNERIGALASMVGLEYPRIVDLERTAREKTVLQANIYVDEAGQEQVMQWFPHCVASRWHPLFADVNPRGVDKAAGMARLLERWGIDASEAVAFGDGGNDVPMLRAAGVGVALGGSCAEALAAADRVARRVEEDGVAHALRELGLIE